MLPRNVRLSIFLVQLVSVATLMRSIAFERWITVFASIMLLVGARAAMRNRAWGVALMFAQAIAFPVAYLIGIAPAWFCVVGALGIMPFVHALPGLMRTDRGATRLLAALAVAFGSAGAIAWKAFAWSIFEAFPSLTPSVYPHHGFIVGAVAALGIATAMKNRHLLDEEASATTTTDTGARMRVATPARIATFEEESAPEEAATEEEEVLGRRMRR